MIKRFLLAAILVLPTMGTANLAVAGVPFPGCYPCPPLPLDSPATAVIAIPADAR